MRPKLSEVLQHLPVLTVDFVFIRPDLLENATAWLQANREQIIRSPRRTDGWTVIDEL